MLLRPIGFSIPSTTELKITFSEEVSSSISISNFEVESLNGAVSDLEVRGVTVDGKVVTVKTAPQVERNYYLLKLLDSTEQRFISEKGRPLVNDNVSRELFFVGIDTVNPVRDRMLQNIPSIFDVDNTAVKEIISTQGKEFYQAQKTIGQVLSDNYLCEEIIDEPRTRTGGAYDRFANEQAFKVTRVSSLQTGQNLKKRTISYNDSAVLDNLTTFPIYPISLQQTVVIDEEVTNTGSDNSFEGFLINLKNKNVIRVLAVTLIREDDTVDCNNSLGTDYNVEKYKYTLATNFYDQDYAYSFGSLESNQVLLSEFGNLDRPKIRDRFLVSYIYKDLSIHPDLDTVEVSRVEAQDYESVPSNSVRFFLDNAPIVNDNNEIVSRGGVTFQTSENDTAKPAEFKQELAYNITRLPQKPGEFAINYETGEVILVGDDETNQGTGRNNYVASYNYRKVFTEDIDYAISDNDLVAIADRGLSSRIAEINYKYDIQYVEGEDYEFSSYIEVLGEFVENRIKDSFTIETKNAPITNVFRIFNQTTGEVYQPNGFSETEIYFTGRRSPEIVTKELEQARFLKTNREPLQVIGEFVSPILKTRITSNLTTNNIQFDPPLPAEFVSLNSEDYIMREVSETETDIEVDDLQIRFFGTPNGENLVSSLGILSTATPPSVGTEVIIGLKSYIVSLENELILNEKENAIGSLLSSSLTFDSNLFLNEKFYQDISINPSFNQTSDKLKLSLAVEKGDTFYNNLSKLRKIGDYTVDYRFGLAYLAVSIGQDRDLGFARYSYGTHDPLFNNIITAAGAYKKGSMNTDNILAEVQYKDFEIAPETIEISDLEHGIAIFDNTTEAPDSNNNLQLIAEVLEDYTAVVPYNIKNISSIVRRTDLLGANLNALVQSFRDLEKTRDELILSARDGGRNIYDEDDITFTNNVIDFKKAATRRVYLGNSGDLEVFIRDANIDTLLGLVKTNNGSVIFEEDLNITKLGTVELVSSAVVGSSADVLISSEESLSRIDTSGDYLIDADGNRFTITAINLSTEIATVSLPSENTGVSTVALGTGSVVVKPTLTSTATGLRVQIPLDSGLIAGDQVTITYLTDLVPTIGTPLAIDYSYGNIYLDYTYLKDNLVIYYEYGDNSLDWSISSTLEEGEQYYVSYQYGALRTGLQDNFGNLTNLSFLRSFSLNIDREIYRSALKGVLQSYPRGPVISSYENLVESLTDIKPEISELSFDQWILGRDTLQPGKIEHEGVLEFKNAKFDSGLFINDGDAVYFPSAASLSLREGSLDAWVIPEWNGIEDDASITFDIDHLGKEREFFSRKDNLFKKGWKYTQPIGGEDEKSFNPNSDSFDFSSIENKYYNYSVNSDGKLEQGTGLVVLEKDNLDVTTKAEFKIEMKIDRLGVNLDGIESLQNITTFDATKGDSGGELNILISDGNTVQLLGLGFRGIGDLSIPTFTISNDTTLPEDRLLIQTRPCLCDLSNDIALYEKFNDILIELTPNSSFTLNSISAIPDYLISDDPGIYIIIDSDNRFFQVQGFLGVSGKVYTSSLPDEAIEKIYLSKPEMSNRNIMTEGSDAINANLPSGDLNLVYKVVDFGIRNEPADTTSLDYYGTGSFYAINWSDYHTYKIVSDPQNNKVDYYIDGEQFEKFYTSTDFPNGILDLNGFAIWNASDILIDGSFKDITTTIYNRYDLSDVYIGRNSYNPRRTPFTVNKEDFPNVAVGAPKNLDNDEGLFIWYDELCRSPLLNDAGQWVFRTRVNKSVRRPISVDISGEEPNTTFEEFDYDFKITGNISTDGEFSSVVRSRKDEVGDCVPETGCSATYRYCGNELLEDGWFKIDDSNSDLINTLIGGTQTSSFGWVKNGDFDTSYSAGIYRLGPALTEVGCDDALPAQLLMTQNPCPNGNFEHTVSMRVVDAPSYTDLYGSGGTRYTGISPIYIGDEDIRIKINLAIRIDGQPLITVRDVSDLSSEVLLETIPFNWNDGQFYEYTLVKDEDQGLLLFYVDNLLYFQTSLENLSQASSSEDIGGYILPVNFIAIQLSRNVESIPNNKTIYPTIVDIDLIEYSANYKEGDGYLESSDILIDTDHDIIFEFNHDNSDGIFVGGYVDSYVDAYSDLFVSDEILFNSDRFRYLVDSGKAEDDSRFSIFKDGKGFLNFRVFKDRGDGESQMYNLATNIKNFKSGDLHHIAASWKLGSFEEDDEMHLFVDGQEAPNIYKFGGRIPVSINDKFSDISKESLQNFLTKDIDYRSTYTGGTVTATLSTFTASGAVFDSSMVGRSILITDSTLAPTLVDKEYVITEVISSTQVNLGRGEDLDQVTFAVSTNDLEWQFAPNAGILSPILTDLNNSRFSIIRVDNAGNEEDMVGLLYRVSNGSVSYLNYSEVSEPKYRANVDTRIIEFVGEDADCNTIATIEQTDVDIYIKTYGLNIERCRDKITLGSNTYNSELSSSFIRTRGVEPTDLLDVEITRVILDNTVIDVDTLTGTTSEFSIDLSADNNRVSSENNLLSFKQNGGRKLALIFDSDNVNYCEYDTPDGYSDGYQDGQESTITIYGTTTDGINEETFYIRRNGKVEGERLFTSVDRVEGTLTVIDTEYYEVANIAIEEVDFITVQNGTGDYAEIYDYKNGRFVLTLNGSAGLVPFELSSGTYRLDYPAPLKVPIKELGQNIYIGTDLNKKNAFEGTIDEFRILNEISTDTKAGENINSSIRSITAAYNKTIPHCPDENTLFLSHFDDPIEFQSRSLRNIEYLDSDNNIKFDLTVEQREELLESINDIEAFVLKMIMFGFDRETAIYTFYNANLAEGGPLFNDAKYYDNYQNVKISSTSVNSTFGKAAIFDRGPGLIVENRNNIFRKDEGTIEFWVSPQIDTDIDNQRRYYFDTMTVSHAFVDSLNSNTIKLNTAAREIKNIRLISNTKEFSSYVTSSDGKNIIYDEITKSEISGILEGGTGVEKDFTRGLSLSADGKTIFLKDSLPGTKIKVLVSYIPKSARGDRVSIYKEDDGRVIFSLTSNGEEISSAVTVDWKKNTWHRISASYKFNRSESASLVRFSVDGENGGIIKYGTGLLFGDGWIYGQEIAGNGGTGVQFNVGLFDDLNYIAFGSDVFGENTARARMDNIRLSRVNRNTVQDAQNNYVDLEFSQNISAAVPVIEDDGTTFIENFDTDNSLLEKFATIRDPKYGIFDFKIDVIDNFDKVIGIADGRIEELIEDLVENLKPAHTNVYLKFRKDSC